MKSILAPEIQTFIQAHTKANPQDLMLQRQKFPDWDMPAVVAQIQARKKALQKLPTWFHTPQIVYQNLALEQCSSEATARFKSQSLQGNTLIDLTGGFGVDSFFLQKNSRK